jgi:hypothetical protein
MKVLSLISPNQFLFSMVLSYSWILLINKLNINTWINDNVNAWRTQVIWEKFTKCIFHPGNGCVRKLMAPSESTAQELSNEWSCQYLLTILNLFGDFCVPPIEVAIRKCSSKSFSMNGHVLFSVSKYLRNLFSGPQFKKFTCVYFYVWLRFTPPRSRTYIQNQKYTFFIFKL